MGTTTGVVSNFLEALGRKTIEQSVTEVVKAAKRPEEKNPVTSRWERPQAALRSYEKFILDSIQYFSDIAENFSGKYSGGNILFFPHKCFP
jgi:hypothetical protein